MKKTTVIFVLIFTLMISLLFAGCGAGSSGSPAGSAGGAKEGAKESAGSTADGKSDGGKSTGGKSAAQQADAKIPDTDESAVGGWGVASGADPEAASGAAKSDGGADAAKSASDATKSNAGAAGAAKSAADANGGSFSKVIVDREDLYFAIKDVRADAALGYTWKLYVENRTDKNLMFTFEKVSVNGVMCDPFWAEIITAGKKGNCEVNWMRDAFEARSIGDVYEVDFTLNVYNDDDYTEAPLMHDPFEVYPMGEDKAAEAAAADEEARSKLLAEGGKVLVDNDTCSIVVTGYEPDNTWGYAMHVFLRNKSGEDLVFSAQNTSVNGIMCDPYWSEIVTSGKSAISTILWDKSALSENDIIEVKQISLPLMVYSDKNIAQPYVDETFELEP